MKSISKKSFYKKRPKGEQSHWEGKYFCDCRVRKFRKWLGYKLYGYFE